MGAAVYYIEMTCFSMVLLVMVLQSIVATPLSDLHEIETLVNELEGAGFVPPYRETSSIQQGFDGDTENGKCDDSTEAQPYSRNSVSTTWGWDGTHMGDIDTWNFIQACLVSQDVPGVTPVTYNKYQRGVDVAVKPKQANVDAGKRCQMSAAKGAGFGGICNFRRYVFDYHKTPECKDMFLYAIKTESSCDIGKTYTEEPWTKTKENGTPKMPYPHCISDYWNAGDAAGEGRAKQGDASSYRTQMAICGAWNPHMDSMIKLKMHPKFDGHEVFIGPGQSASTEVCQKDWNSGNPFTPDHPNYNPDEYYPVDEAKQIVFCPLSQHGFLDRHNYGGVGHGGIGPDLDIEWVKLGEWA